MRVLLCPVLDNKQSYIKKYISKKKGRKNSTFQQRVSLGKSMSSCDEPDVNRATSLREIEIPGKFFLVIFFFFGKKF